MIMIIMIIIVIKIRTMIIMIKIKLIKAAITLNSPSQPSDFSTGSTTSIGLTIEIFGPSLPLNSNRIIQSDTILVLNNDDIRCYQVITLSCIVAVANFFLTFICRKKCFVFTMTSARLADL